MEQPLGNFLPADVLLKIFSQLKFCELASVARTCKRFNALSSCDSLWNGYMARSRYKNSLTLQMRSDLRARGKVKETCCDIVTNRCWMCDVYTGGGEGSTLEGRVRVCAKCKIQQTPNWLQEGHVLRHSYLKGKFGLSKRMMAGVPQVIRHRKQVHAKVHNGGFGYRDWTHSEKTLVETLYPVYEAQVRIAELFGRFAQRVRPEHCARVLNQLKIQYAAAKPLPESSEDRALRLKRILTEEGGVPPARADAILQTDAAVLSYLNNGKPACFDVLGYLQRQQGSSSKRRRTISSRSNQRC